MGTLTPKHVHLLSVVFFYPEENWGMDVISQEWLKIEVKLLLNANRKSYMLRRLA